MIPVDEVSVLKAQMEKIKLEMQELRAKPIVAVRPVCALCGGEHNAEECGAGEAYTNASEPLAVNALNQYGRTNDPYNNNYNPGWRNHPNFSWRDAQNNQGGFQSQPR